MLLEFRPVDAEAQLTCHLFRDVDEKAIRGMQIESCLAADAFRFAFSGFRNDVVEEFHTARIVENESLFLGKNDVLYSFRLATQFRKHAAHQMDNLCYEPV